MAAYGETKAEGIAKGCRTARYTTYAEWSYKTKNRLNYPLLSDWNKTVSTAYGVLYDRFGSFGLHGVTKRSVFVLDAGGVIPYKWVTEEPKSPPDHHRILEEGKKQGTLDPGTSRPVLPA